MANGGDVKDLLDRIEAKIAEVRRQYDLFFQGVRRSEPADKRREIEDAVRRMGQRKITNTNDQFRFNNLQCRFYSYINLWARMVRDLEEGRMTRDASGMLVRGGPPPQDLVDPSHMNQVILDLMEARKTCGLSAVEGELSATREALQARAREIAEKSGGRKVEFRVTVEEGKPKIKAVVS
jgi:hypothetical protein